MNKKLLGVFISIIFISICAFILFDRKSDEEKVLAAISWFIYEQTGEFEQYRALEFIEITNEMLLNDIALKEQLTIAQDTLREKSRILEAYHKLPKSWAKEVAQFEGLKPDQIDDYLKINAKLNIALKAINVPNAKEAILSKQEHALQLIEAKLNALNLSVYSIDLSAQNSIHYLHRFALDGKEVLSVFEIDVQTQKIISYKNIG